MAFDFEKAKIDREKFKEKREAVKQERVKQAISPTPEEGKNTYSVLLDVLGEDNSLPVLDVKADNPAAAIIRACEKRGITEKQIIKKNCRARDSNTGELFEADGTPS